MIAPALACGVAQLVILGVATRSPERPCRPIQYH